MADYLSLTRIEKGATMLPVKFTKDQNLFWHVTILCLKEFHQETEIDKLRKLQQKMRKWSAEEIELFFHAEPFDVACNIAGTPLLIEDHLERYLEIRERKKLR